MSGLVGWVDFSPRDLEREPAVLSAMADALATRGPDGQHVWTRRDVGLGFRALAIGARPAPRQPHVRSTPDGPITVCVTGTPVGLGALAAWLRGRGRGVSDDAGAAELVAAAYQEDGTAAVVRLTGAFAVAIWDGRRDELVLVRDRFGNQPLYYWVTDTGLVFGSERKALFAHPETEAAVNLDGMRELFSYAGTAGHGIFAGIRQVEAAEILRFSRAGLRREKYWRLTTAEHTDDLDTTIGTVRELLSASVADQLGDADGVGIMLSGGVDSSAVTALAGDALKRRGGGKLRTFTVTFAEHADNFTPDEVWATPDAPFVRDMVAHVGAEHTDVVLDTADILDPAVREATLVAKDVPSPLGNMNTSLHLLDREVSKHVQAALLGEIADAVFGGFSWVHNPQLAAAQTMPWIAMAHYGGGKHGMGGDLLHPDLLDKLQLNDYCAAAWESSVAQVQHLDGESDIDRKMRRINYLHLTRWLETLLSHDESIGMSTGLEVRMPFCDDRLVQYVYNVPWAQKSFDGQEKSLLRAAVADLLPESVRSRPKSPYPVTQDPAYGKWLMDQLGTLVADPLSPAAALVDKKAIAALRADHAVLDSGPRAWVARANVEMVLGLDAWLRRYGVRVEV
ncbi:asparagine synthase (glutamine-hydrolyzing) [Couchioplanes caeruleus]|uniref:asparagine synthase (glutamine-hydrolyzing) n=2 Tax=Couchioplanes caeruleus TaxID=56438 RepID=A0A1K0GUG2_9ACTN|nr:asparagine synthase (glutamine-hydrolyzing) [Couchioplanes caeruleus]OJF16150.1 asparagine synthase (glutamine-hydrolyzing) [Couchioplanes caeruleus subsp. caeruleus]ROP34040.1 asparagine synthase (glutamine-hydrolysing) [Couchioplanes caeruleus]